MAVAVAIISTMIALWFCLRSQVSEGQIRLGWLFGASVVSGSGVWATAFFHLLAQYPDAPMSFDVWLGGFALLFGVAMAGLSFGIVAFGHSRATHLIGGTTYGLGLTCVHYTVTSSIRGPIAVEYDAALLGISTAVTCIVAVLAFVSTFKDNLARPVIVGSSLLLLSIGVTEGVGEIATKLTFAPHFLISGLLLDRASILTALMMLLPLYPAAVIFAVFVDRGLHHSRKLEADRLRMLANMSLEGIAIHADGKVLDANEAYAKIVDYPLDEIIGAPTERFAAPEYTDTISLNITAQSTTPYEVELIRRDGKRVPVELRGKTIDFHGRTARAVVIRDLSSKKIAEEQIRYLAHHDALTGLPNRALFQDRLNQVLARAYEQSEQVAVLTVNIDRFKRINDVFGHSAGDTLLHDVAIALSKSIGSTDTLARMGGDEFAIIQPAKAQPESAADCANRLLSAFKNNFGPEGQDVDVDLSIGISIYPENGKTAEELLLRADMGLNRARDEGGGRYHFYEATMDAKLRLRHSLEQDLRAALAEDELQVHYQAQADIKTGQVNGFEALLRWEHPERGWIPPNEFIPIAEESNLIVSLSEWVLRRACADASTWPSNVRVSVNLSAEQFKREDVAQTVKEVLQSCDLAPSRLELEITETVLIEDAETALVTLHKLKSLGVRIAMDDFGTGYSSLSYLQRFPFDKIKIDRAFVSGVDQNAGSRAIIRAVTGLGDALGLSVIAEGVETPAELEVLTAENCDEIQGYLLSRPVPVEDLPAVMSRQLERVAAEMRSADVTEINVVHDNLQTQTA